MKVVASYKNQNAINFYKKNGFEEAVERKKLTISFNNKILIKDEIMDTPSLMKLQFDDDKLVDITYFKV